MTVNWKVQNDLVFNNYSGTSSHIENLFDAIGQQVMQIMLPKAILLATHLPKSVFTKSKYKFISRIMNHNSSTFVFKELL